MESSTSSTTLNLSSSSSRSPHKNSFSSELFINAEISNKLHLHSTTRRIFIGPKPINWSYKKKSFFFPKSIYAEPLKIVKKKPAQSDRNCLPSSNVIISKRERRVTFIASRDSIGSTNLSSLDYYEIISKSRRSSVEIVTDSKFLVSEPQDLESGPSGENKTSEIYYTPTENLNTNPISPPNTKHVQTYFPSPLGNEPGTSRVPFSDVNNDVNSKASERFHTPTDNNVTTSEGFYTPTDIVTTNPTTESRNVFDEQIDQEGDNINHKTIPSTDENSEINNGDKPKYVRFSESTATTKPSSTIIKQGPMLVRINFEEESKEHLVDYLSNHFTKSSNWKELMVKLKPGGIELCGSKNKIIESISFTSTTKLSLFSSSDYTISISQPTKHYIKNFILNPKTISLSIQWYQAIYKLFPESVNKPIPCTLDVIIPDLDVKLRIPLCDNNNEEGSGCNNEDNEGFTLLNISAEKVMNVVLNELSEITEWDDVLSKWVKSNHLRLCWKRYEKLEWIDLKENGDVWNDILNCPQFIEQTHQLQLRPIEHYPTTVKLRDGTKLTEPPPIEGYLIKITNNKSQNKKSKKLYFTSQNNYLFFLNPLKASPPPPPNVSTVTTDGDEIQFCDNSQQHPLIYAVSPYIQDKIVGDNDTFMKSDMKRKVKQILHANGFIDLTEIVEIKCLKNDGKTEEGLEENLNEEVEGEGCLFKLLLKNGGIVSLKAYSKQTRKEWVNHLNELANYWKDRLKQDVRIKADNIKINQSIYRENKNNDELHNHNWENFKSYADPFIWNWCILDGCRGITKAGLLYHKRHKRQPFQIYHHVLTRGHFVYFNHHMRSTLTGCVLSRSYYKRKGCINLRDCYVYSGSSITEHEYYKSNLPQEQSIVKSYSQGPLAKLYGDGMISYDDYRETSFVIWKGRRKYYFNNDGMKISMEKTIKYDIPGEFWIFRARNRVEREEWVWALNVEIERLYGEENDEIK